MTTVHQYDRRPLRPADPTSIPAGRPTVALDATPLLGRPTGIGVVVGGLLRSLAEGHLVDLVGYGVTGTGWRQLPGRLPRGVRAGRGPLPAAVAHRLWRRGEHPDLRWWTGRVDVVHGTNYVVPPARRAARLVTVHDLTALRYPQLCAPAALRYPDLVAAALRGGAAVHTAAHSVAAEIEDHFGVEPDRISVVEWGIDPAPARHLPARAGPPYVLGLGTVEPRKDFPLLVRAFAPVAASVADLELVLAGPEGWGEEDLKAAIAASPVRGRIRRLGWVEDTDALVRQAAVLAFPSVYEGFGLPPLEAMAREVPVVATRVGALPEILGDGAALVEAGDADALAAAILEAVTDDARREALIAAGRRQVDGFTWARTAERMAALYRGLDAP